MHILNIGIGSEVERSSQLLEAPEGLTAHSPHVIVVDFFSRCSFEISWGVVYH